MGTRATVTITDKKHNDELLCKLYVHLDGYPAGLGASLAKLMRGKKIVNGIPIGRSTLMMYNGMGCFAASVISVLKTGIGGVYLTSASHGEEEYNYHIKSLDDITVHCYDNLIFKGNAEEFSKFCDEREFDY